MEDQTFIYIFITSFVLVIAYLISLQTMFNAAKNSDSTLFEELGSPHIFHNNTPSHTLKALKTLLLFKYLQSNSKKVVMWGNITMVFFVLVLFSYFGLFYVSL